MNNWLNTKLDRKRRGDGGLTLVELLVAITILGVISAIVILKIGGLKDNADLVAVASSAKAIETAQQVYCLDHQKYGDLDDLVAAGLIKAPEDGAQYRPQIHVDTVDADVAGAAPLLNGCGRSVYTAYPQIVTQINGKQVAITEPPKRVFVSGGGTGTGIDTGTVFESVAALGVLPIGGTLAKTLGGNGGGNGAVPTPNSTDDQTTHGPYGFSPLLNTGPTSLFQATAVGSTADKAMAMTPPPDIIVGNQPGSLAQFLNRGKPVFAISQQTVALSEAATESSLSQLPWFNSFMAMATILNRKAEAVEFLDAFQKEAAKHAPALRGVTVSVINQRASTSPTGSSQVNVLSDAINPSWQYSALTPFLAYMGLKVKQNCSLPCTPYPDGSGGGQTTIANLAANSSWVPGTHLISLADAFTYLTPNRTLFGGPLSGLPQLSCTGHGGSCVLVTDYTFGSLVPSGGVMTVGSTTVDLPDALVGNGTTRYCTSASATQGAGIPIIAGLSCSGSTVTGYTPVAQARGIWPSGPISQLAAMRWVKTDLGR